MTKDYNGQIYVITTLLKSKTMSAIKQRFFTPIGTTPLGGNPLRMLLSAVITA